MDDILNLIVIKNNLFIYIHMVTSLGVSCADNFLDVRLFYKESSDLMELKFQVMNKDFNNSYLFVQILLDLLLKLLQIIKHNIKL